ncbi:hypothetical protein C8J56DRAFT_1041240 [Mycena floridula]|nr:hypothetical protein C8J56DRAFT_1041240 [Mycena floridula]
MVTKLIRRIVAGTDAQGIGNVQSDTLLESKEIPTVKGATSSGIWKTLDSLPTDDNNKIEDGAKRSMDSTDNLGIVPLQGTNIQSTELPADGMAPMHRTSSLDYNILIEGELVLIMEDGTETLLRNPGDVVVMKGGMHAWKNPSSTQPVRWITVLMSANPVVVGSSPLKPGIQETKTLSA